MKLIFSKTNVPLGGLLAVEYLKSNKNLSITTEWGEETVIVNCNNEISCATDNEVSRAVARLLDEMGLYGATPIEKTEVDHWLTLAQGVKSNNEFLSTMEILNRALIPVTYLVGRRLTIADFVMFSSLYANKEWNNFLSQQKAPLNILRWFTYVENLDFVRKTLDTLPDEIKSKLMNDCKAEKIDDKLNVGNRAREGKFVELPGAEMGKVVVRFPPEASGYLHIGHAKAALLNQYYQETFKGKLVMRFDDTNPAKENVHFEKVILEDVELLEIKPDVFSHTSQYFDLMLDYCEKLLNDGKAYVDDTEPEIMKTQREQKIESSNRNNSCVQNFNLWQEMKKGSDIGQKCCVRAKIDMQSANGCMRDPTIYRCKNEPHPRTGYKYKVYPTYDFACPIVDAIEGVTHTLRTMEYHDRDPQFYWFIEALGLRKPHIWEYSRLSMTNTVLSKRKLTWFVDEKLVDGWDDPRMPTVRGVLRRGMTVQGLKEFIIAQGSSRSVVFMEWDKIWAFNKKVIDPIAPRYTAVDYDSPVTVLVDGAKEEECLSVPKHPKNTNVGEKSVWTGAKIIIDRADAECLKEGENATFINWGNLMIRKINRENGEITTINAGLNLENKDYKKTMKLTWLAVTQKGKFTPTWCVYFDHIISKPVLGKDEDFKQFIAHETRKEVQMLGDPELKQLKKGDIIQLQRKGFFIVDVPYGPLSLYTCKEQPIILFYIPDGHTKDNPITSVSKQTNKATNSKGEKIENKNASTSGTLLTQQPSTELEGESPKQLINKNIPNTNWKPDCTASTNVSKASIGNSDDLDIQIAKQGAKVRQLKSEKANKATVNEQVTILLALKAEYKKKFAKDWAPAQAVISNSSQNITQNTNVSLLIDEKPILDRISSQGEKVRELKANKAEKGVINAEVSVLLALKAEYKTLTGKDWKPETNQSVKIDAVQKDSKLKMKTNSISACPKTTTTSSTGGNNSTEEILIVKITEHGDIVRNLKAQKAAKTEVDAAVKVLLGLKVEYKNLTGTDFPAPARSDGATKSKPNTAKVRLVDNKKEEIKDVVKKQTRLGLEAKKEENLADWYSQVITKGEMIEYYDVSGCYIYRPWSFAIWESIREWFDKQIKELGVQNCYFPIFVSKNVLEKEKTHIADFAPEVAWVTKSGESDMAEPIAVRPTSETVMYPAYSKWIQSYRDLPIKLNQWNNVVRWEFKHPQPFLRTREFLWQEGHTAYANQDDACNEVDVILDLYAKIYTDLLAIPVIKGRKTEKEKFAGADYTLTVESFISASGRAIQGATSHHLGQNFSKIFDIIYEDPDTQEKKYVYQNSWGITTRTIGVMIMMHADNQGLVLPPNVASIQIVIVPCGITVNLSENDKNRLQTSCNQLENDLRRAGIKIKGDYRINYSPGWKFNHWELKGVPIRIELGPKDIEKQQIVAVRRDTGDKIIVQRNNAVGELTKLLETIQSNLLENATVELRKHTVLLKDWKLFNGNLDKKNIILAPFCGMESCEDKIKMDSTRDDAELTEAGAPSMGAKSLCIPLEQPSDIQATDKCIHPACKNSPKFYTLFGRSY